MRIVRKNKNRATVKAPEAMPLTVDTIEEVMETVEIEDGSFFEYEDIDKELPVEVPPIKRDEFVSGLKEEVALYEKVLLATLNSSERSMCSEIEASAKRVELIMSENNKKIEGFIEKQNSLLEIATRKSGEDNFVEVFPFSDSSAKDEEEEEKFYEVKKPTSPKKKMKLHPLTKKGIIAVAVLFAIYLGFGFLASQTAERFELTNIAPPPPTEAKPVDTGAVTIKYEKRSYPITYTQEQENLAMAEERRKAEKREADIGLKSGKQIDIAVEDIDPAMMENIKSGE